MLGIDSEKVAAQRDSIVIHGHEAGKNIQRSSRDVGREIGHPSNVFSYC